MSNVATLPPRLNPYYQSNPVQEASSLKRKAILLKVSEIVMAIAIAAIMGAVLVVSLGASVTLASYQTALFIGVLCTIPLSLGMTQLHENRMGIEQKRVKADLLAASYVELRAKTDAELQQLLLHEQIQIPEGQPIRTILPVLANYVTAEKIRKNSLRNVHQDLSFQNPDRGIVLFARLKGWQRLQTEVLPAHLTAQLMRSILQNPYLADIEIPSIRLKGPAELYLDSLIDHSNEIFVPAPTNQNLFDELIRG